MTTPAVTRKFEELAGALDMTAAEIRFVAKHWDDAPKKLQTCALKSVEVLPKIPPTLQCLLINTTEKAVKAIGELLCPDAQDLIVQEYPEDLPFIVRKADMFKTLSDSFWQALAEGVEDPTDFKVPAKLVKYLITRKDCPDEFLKAAGFDKKAAGKQRIKSSVTRRIAHASKSVKDQDVEDDFEDVVKVSKAARTVKRPRS